MTCTLPVVCWNNLRLTPSCISPTKIKVNIPPSLLTDPGTINISVLLDGQQTKSIPFTITDCSISDLISLSPRVMRSGKQTQLKITGNGFTTTSVVTWDREGIKNILPVLSWESTLIVASLIGVDTTSPGTIKVTVWGPCGVSNTLLVEIG